MSDDKPRLSPAPRCPPLLRRASPIALVAVLGACDAGISGPDAGNQDDAGTVVLDAGIWDGGWDGGVAFDGGLQDAAVFDAGLQDAALPDDAGEDGGELGDGGG